ncbi:trypsin-like peptidase domain-containing protein [Neogemmobacter tilapiae]|uniref:Serine protease n=1 Tax=Neogemmobacter tilapiae TaxID=875041 RepID=A0A918TNU5_9RHOB|nr:trypsin-like peptidase domain-containing protein [Gemmobacter tilapiae]GHC53130.1 serine protease [Gemmobacter tilapiae]
MRLVLAFCLSLWPLPLLAQEVPESQGQITLSFAPVVKMAAPAVVNIYATVVVQDRGPFAGDPFFQDFFGNMQGSARLENALGSGVIVGADGVVVSNYHVIENATEIRVVLTDKREFQAEVLLADKDSDLAVLKLAGAADLPVLPLRDSDTLEVGDLVLAIGNPFGVGQTVSSGIISATARSGLSIGSGRGLFLQTDAAINPGNSGGALVDMQGQLVGINTAILSRGGGSNGIGFAIPSNLLRSFIDQAQAGESRFQRPWAGMTGQPVDAALADALGMVRPEGMVISELHPESPFAKAGLRPGDVIVSLNNQPVGSPQEAIFHMSAAGIGAMVDVGYVREGAALVASLTLIAPPDVPAAEPATVMGDVALQGLTVARVNPRVAADFDLEATAEGVVVIALESYAARSGLRPGDVIVAINGLPVGSPQEVLAAAGLSSRRWVIDVVRGGQPLRIGFRF